MNHAYLRRCGANGFRLKQCEQANSDYVVYPHPAIIAAVQNIRILMKHLSKARSGASAQRDESVAFAPERLLGGLDQILSFRLARLGHM